VGIKAATAQNRPWEIYALVDPRTDEVRYVGVTHRPKLRMVQHFNEARSGGATHKARWLSILLKEGLRPLRLVIDSGCGNGWQEKEKYWIAKYRNLGFPLTNISDGGEGALGVPVSDEVRKKRSEARKNWKPRPEHLEALLAYSRSMTGKHLSAEHRAKISAAHKGKPHTPEHNAAVARANTGKKHSEETKQKLSIAQRGKHNIKHTPEACEKISKAKKGKKRRPLTAEHRAKQSAALRGRKWSEKEYLSHCGKKRGPCPQERRERISHALRGRVRPLEASAKQSATYAARTLAEARRISSEVCRGLAALFAA